MSKISPGLTEVQAAEKLCSDGPNELPTAKPKSNLTIVVEVLREPMFLLLLATGTIYFFLGDFREAAALATAIGVIISITVYQERKTERTLDALRDLSSPRALVIRDGVERRIAGREVVCGDLVRLVEGDRVPADAFVLETTNIAVDESLLTGESAPVRKSVWDGVSQSIVPGGEDLPIVFSGTMVVRGRATTVVTATGVRTELGKIGVSLKGIEIQRTGIESSVDRLVRAVGLLAFACCGVVAVFVGLRRDSWTQGALSGLALAISLVPEEFPVVLTIFMALGAWRIAQRRVLTRRVAAIENLGAATVLCADKTGTLTMNRMTVREVFPAAQQEEIIRTAALASQENPIDPSDKAIAVAAAADPSRSPGRFVEEYALSRQLLMMSRAYGDDGRYEVAAKGAPEAVLGLCRLDSFALQKTSAAADAMAASGLRVFGVARAVWEKQTLPATQTEFDFEFMGLIGLEDPFRPGVPESIQQCTSAGIRVVMITGDHALTAQTIASRIGLHNPTSSLSGAEIELMSDSELQVRAAETNVFARIMPNQKLRLVEILKANGEVVAMTGDGVNDAPALKSANIGIAMGGRGTDVAREAGALVLLDDDFLSIVEAVRLGRRIYDNLRKAFTYILAIHVAIAGLALIPVIMGIPLLLLPLHLVLLELIIDPACSIAFESEPEDADIMRRRPRDPRAALFDQQMLLAGALQGLGLLLVTLLVFIVALKRNPDEFDARALSFTTMILGNIALIWSNRHWRYSIVQSVRTPNRALWWITSGTLAALFAVLYVPAAQHMFGFSHLHSDDLAVCFGASVVAFFWFEGVKRLIYR